MLDKQFARGYYACKGADCMTIKEAAVHYGVSTQAIYQRVSKAGKKAKDITNAKTGDLTSDGESLLASWFTNEVAADVETSCKRCKELEMEIASLKAEKAALQVQVAEIQKDKDRLYSLLNQAQQTAQALSLARIGSSSTAGTLPLWERVKVFFMGSQANKDD